MSVHRIWKRVLGVEHTVVEGVDLVGGPGAESVVVRVRPSRSRRALLISDG